MKNRVLYIVLSFMFAINLVNAGSLDFKEYGFSFDEFENRELIDNRAIVFLFKPSNNNVFQTNANVM